MNDNNAFQDTQHGGAIGTLYLDELKGTMRGRFAWLGAAVVLLAVGGLATAGTQDTWLDGYGIIAYLDSRWARDFRLAGVRR